MTPPASKHPASASPQFRTAFIALFANQATRVWVLGVQFVTAPIIAHILDPESYGFIGLYMALLGFLMFLNQGPWSMIARLFADWSTSDDRGRSEIVGAFRALELVTVATALLAGASLQLSAPWFVGHWLHAAPPSQDHTILTLRLIGLTIFCQWFHGFYAACYAALNRQFAFSAPVMVFATIQNIGAVFVLSMVGPKIELYFVWMAALWAILNIYSRARLFSLIPELCSGYGWGGTRLRNLLRFGVGTTFFAAANAALMQMDKFAVSHFVSLAEFTAYVLSFAVASLVVVISAGPISTVLLPRISQLTARGDVEALAEEYHLWTQVLVFLALSTAATLVTFSYPLLQLWLGSGSPLISPIAKILPWAAAGTFLSAIASLPLALQWGHGWTRLSLYKSTAALAAFTIALNLTIPRYGVMGGAWCWLALNLCYLLIEVPLMHVRLLPGELRKWLIGGILLPVLTTAMIFGGAALVIPMTDGKVCFNLLLIAAVVAVNSVALLIVMPQLRDLARSAISRLRQFVVLVPQQLKSA